MNRVAILARKLARVPTRVVVRTGTTVSHDMPKRSAFDRRLHYLSMRYLYRWADAIITPSAGAAADLATFAGIPSSRDNGGVNGYHCWVEFYADGKWWPVDILEADKYSALSTYYFGHHPANRVEFTRGRDLVVTPGPASGPINFLAYPVLEVNGKPVKAPIKFTFTRSRSQA